jgi:small subunit ribosomal protein S17
MANVKDAKAELSEGNQIGKVVSDKREKTITVEVGRLIKHARYSKYLKRTTWLHAHDEKNEAKVGDKVEIAPTRPLSKQKRFKLVKIIERGADLTGVELKETEVPGVKKKEAKEAAPAAK